MTVKDNYYKVLSYVEVSVCKIPLFLPVSGDIFIFCFVFGKEALKFGYSVEGSKFTRFQPE